MDENAWPLVPEAEFPPLRRGKVPGTNRVVIVRDGSAGYLLLDYMTWFHKNIEPIDKGQLDEWGWSYRPNANNPGFWSRHARAIAVDINATQHPNGKKNTFTLVQRAKMKLKLATRYRGCLRSGEFYHSTTDGMHIEIDKDLPTCEARARKLMVTPLGKRVLDANPGLRAAILS